LGHASACANPGDKVKADAAELINSWRRVTALFSSMVMETPFFI
jgi:hypothetical protein